MGGNNVKPKDPRDEIEDSIIEMRMTSKQFENAARRSQRDQKKEIDKARQALKKGNEEGAKLFLQNAATKYRESQNLTRMAHRMDAISMNLKANMNNTDLMKTLSNLTPKLKIQEGLMNPTALTNNLGEYQKAMDDLMIAGKIMDSAMNENMHDEASENGVENMLNVLKQDIANEINANLATDPTLIFNNIQSADTGKLDVMAKK